MWTSQHFDPKIFILPYPEVLIQPIAIIIISAHEPVSLPPPTDIVFNLRYVYVATYESQRVKI